MGEALLSPQDFEMLETRRKVQMVEAQMRALPAEAHVKIEPEHFSHGGIYARKITIPAGTLLTGEIHKYDNMNFMLSGDMLVLVGTDWARIRGPEIIFAPAGIKRIAFALTETVWVTVLPTNEQNPQVIEKMFVASTEEEYQQFLTLARAEMTKCLS